MLNKNKNLRKLYLAAGLLFLALGAVGVFIPVLPTTPFLLLAAAMFMRSSERLYLWLTNHQVLGPFIRNYRLYHAVPLYSKITALFFLYLTIGSSVVFFVNNWWLRGILVIVAAAVSWHIIKLKTLTPEMLAEIRMREAASSLTMGADTTPASD